MTWRQTIATCVFSSAFALALHPDVGMLFVCAIGSGWLLLVRLLAGENKEAEEESRSP